MKSKQLKNTLGAITVSEDRIERTMAYIRAEKVDAARKKEGYSPKITFVTRLAGAMCALLLVVGIGIYGFGHVQELLRPVLTYGYLGCSVYEIHIQHGIHRCNRYCRKPLLLLACGVCDG